MPRLMPGVFVFPGEVMRWWLKKNLLFEEKNR